MVDDATVRLGICKTEARDMMKMKPFEKRLTDCIDYTIARGNQCVGSEPVTIITFRNGYNVMLRRKSGTVVEVSCNGRVGTISKRSAFYRSLDWSGWKDAKEV